MLLISITFNKNKNILSSSHPEKEVASRDVEMASPEVSRQSSRDSTKTTSPLTVSSGIMTKRGPIVEEVTASVTVFSV